MIIDYFIRNKFITNTLFVLVFLFGIFSWFTLSKEEMPEFVSQWSWVTISYPGATAKEVERLITIPIERELTSLVGIEEVTSTSSQGFSVIRIVIDDHYPYPEEVFNEVQDAVQRADLPSDLKEIPKVKQFKSSEKAIMDIGLYVKGKRILSTEDRLDFQKRVKEFEEQVVALSSISSVTTDYYLAPELVIEASPRKLETIGMDLNSLRQVIIDNNVKNSLGELTNKQQDAIVLENPLEDPQTLENLIIKKVFQGPKYRLKDVATVRWSHEKAKSIFNISGHEGIFLNVKKSSQSDIISSKKELEAFIENYQKIYPSMGVSLMDDESYAVRNRLSIIGSNGFTGFILILVTLTLFLNFKTSFWVAMGIPFSVCLTMIMAKLFDQTINNMTLSGVIIVLGIVVDDAIIISDHITRLKEQGLDNFQACVQGVREVFKPVLASILTTCVAFIPLIYFEGFFGKLVAYIPLIITLMLFSSLIESTLFLPAHLDHKIMDKSNSSANVKKWFVPVERKYAKLLNWCLEKWKLSLFISLIIFSTATYLFYHELKYVMFPRVESKEVIIQLEGEPGISKIEMARKLEVFEDYIQGFKDQIINFRLSIGQSRRGQQALDHKASMLVELKPRDERTRSLNDILEQWETESKRFSHLYKIKILKGRWGHSSGSAIDLEIQHNEFELLTSIADDLKEQLLFNQEIKNVEIDRPLEKDEYVVSAIQEKVSEYNIPMASLSNQMRSFFDGTLLYRFIKGADEVFVRLRTPETFRDDANKLNNTKVLNSNMELIPASQVLTIEKRKAPTNIMHTDFKRSLMLYADLKEESQKTPLEIANFMEESIFPLLNKKYPGVQFKFKGEIEESREGMTDFLLAVFITIVMIYFILVFIFQSLSIPLLVLSIVPFSLVSLVFVLLMHGQNLYGFFSSIGALGMIGVVVNDAIVMIQLFINKERSSDHNLNDKEFIKEISTQRLRPILLTTITTVIGVFPTAYSIAGYDDMLSDMMLMLGWGLSFGLSITLFLLPLFYMLYSSLMKRLKVKI